MASITITGVRKSFGAVEVLKGVDLAIAEGEFVVLVGPSGCGKSTLLRLIAGLEALSEGEIRIGERRVDDLAPRDRDIAMVFQSYALYPHMSVRDNIAYSLKLRRQAPDAIARAVAGAARKLGLEALVERRPRALSGGQRQRVAMGRAIVRDPKAFLWDEPLSNLDARLREHMRFEIKTLHRDLGATSVYVTHDQIEAMTMADRIVAVEGGVIRQVGTPLDVYDDPANAFVAGFIGAPAINLVEARAAPAPGGGVALVHGGMTLVELPPGLPLRAGETVTVGLRPERLRLEAMAPAGGPVGRVTLVEPTGLGTVVYFDLGGALLKLFTTERVRLRVGEAAPIGFAAADVLLFDPRTGARIRPRSL